MSARVRDAWVAEVNSRLRAYREGRTQPIPAAEAIAQIREQVRQRRDG